MTDIPVSIDEEDEEEDGEQTLALSPQLILTLSLRDRAVLRDGWLSFSGPRLPVAPGRRGGCWDFRGLRVAAKNRFRWAWDGAALVTRCGAACQAGEARALAAALRRTAAAPQTAAAGQLDAMAILMRRTLTRTSAPILSSLRRMVPQGALANGV